MARVKRWAFKWFLFLVVLPLDCLHYRAVGFSPMQDCWLKKSDEN